MDPQQLLVGDIMQEHCARDGATPLDKKKRREESERRGEVDFFSTTLLSRREVVAPSDLIFSYFE